MLDKKSLRQNISRQKRALSAEQIEAFSRDLTERFCRTEEYRRAKSVYAYLPYNQEVRTWAIIDRARADGKRVAVPKVYGDVMRFLWLDDPARIAPGAYGIPEPIDDAPQADDERALILMPGLAFDPQGHRVGYGGGFYDKYLAEHARHTLVALCYPFQLFERLCVESHDVPVKRVICAGDAAPRPAYRLIAPTAEYADQIAAYRREFLDAGDSLDGTGSLSRMEDPADWLRQTEDLRKPETVPAGWVPSSQFICVRAADNRLVGMIQLRHRFNAFLEKFGGNIGYSVRPDERRQGCAKWMLRAVLPCAHALGLNRVLVTCLQQNEASRRTILACGGEYESTAHDPDRDAHLERYWIANDARLELLAGAEHPQEIRALFDEYTRMLRDAEPEFDRYLRMQGYDAEAEHPEAKYGAPNERLYLARFDGKPAGCIALRNIDGTRCEMKRLYVRPEFRGHRIGEVLMERILLDGRALGYTAMRLDTLPCLDRALRLYVRRGFVEIPRYNDSPVENSIFLELKF